MKRSIPWLAIAICACSGGGTGRSARGPEPAAADPLIGQLEAELRANPDKLATMYALAMLNDRAGDADAAATWLDRLAATRWDAGLDPADFATLRERAADRLATARAAIERRWVQKPTAREHVRVRGERDLLPEGMTRLPATGELLISSGRKRKVVAVAPDGATRDFVAGARDGLLATLGLHVDAAHGRLWVASAAAPFMENAGDVADGTSRLHAFDLATGELRARYERAAPSLLNDVVVLPDGRAAVTDSAGGALWVTATGADGTGTLEPLVAAGSLTYPNGLALGADGALLYVANWDGVSVVDWRTGAVALLALPDGATHLVGIDGLYLHDGALIGIQNAVGRPRVVRVSLSADGRAATRIDVLETGSPIVDNPTTGVVVDAELLFLARRNREQAFASGAADPAALDDIVIAAVPLR
jgi:sugar lactone lactonase YvrE